VAKRYYAAEHPTVAMLSTVFQELRRTLKELRTWSDTMRVQVLHPEAGKLEPMQRLAFFGVVDTWETRLIRAGFDNAELFDKIKSAFETAVSAVEAWIRTEQEAPEAAFHIKVAAYAKAFGHQTFHAGRPLTLSGATQDLEDRLNEAIDYVREIVNYHDSVTGCPNRFLLEKTLDRISYNKETRDLGIILIDLDRFKRVNDTHGREAGDRILREVADVLRATTRANVLGGVPNFEDPQFVRSDMEATPARDKFQKDDVQGLPGVFRSGGEEFVYPVQAPETVLPTIAERIRKNIDEHAFSHGVHLTASIGFSSVNELDGPFSALTLADNARFRAKELGRNQIVAARMSDDGTKTLFSV